VERGVEGGVRLLASRGEATMAKKPSFPELHRKHFASVLPSAQVEFEWSPRLRAGESRDGGGGSEPLSLSARALASSLHTSLPGHAVCGFGLPNSPAAKCQRERERVRERASERP